MTRHPLAFTSLGVVACAMLPACSTLWGFDDLNLEPSGPDASDASIESAPPIDAAREAAIPDAATEADALPAEAGCVLTRWPAPPATDDGPATADYVLAWKTLDLGAALNQGDNIGFDLDSVCTCPGPESCTLPASAKPSQSCDQSGGRDDEANPLLSTLGVYDKNLSQAALQSDLTAGKFGLVFRVRNYNGLGNDKSVIVEVYDSAGTVRNGAGKPTPPLYDGSDVWTAYSDSVIGGTDPTTYVAKYSDIAAYVSNHVLVAQFASVPITVRPDTGAYDNPYTMTLTDVHLTGTLTPDGQGRFRIDDGDVGARWRASDALKSFSTLSDLQGNFLCGTQAFYGVIASNICLALDISADPAADNTGKACSALSLAVGFKATAANLGSLLDPPVTPSQCPTPWQPTCP